MTGIYIYSIKRLAIFHITASTEMLDEMQENGPLTEVGNCCARDYATMLPDGMVVVEDFELSPTVATIQTITKAVEERNAIELEASTPATLTTFQKL